MKQTIKVTANGKTEAITNEIRNITHFETQLNTKANVFINRKKRAKNGYSKHKNAEEAY